MSNTIPFVVPNADTSLAAIRDRAIGALLGLAVGDAVGTTLEFRGRDSYEPLTDMVGGGPFGLNAGEWTDDTSQALILADSLVAYPRLNEQDLMERFVAWHEKGDYSCTGRCFDIGITTSNALARFKRTGNPVAGSTDLMSAGNGSLMRLAPVAIRFWNDRDSLIDAAARQSRTTHGAREAVDACVALAEMMADAIAGRPVEEFIRGGEGPYAGAIGYIVGGSWRGKQRHELGSSGYVAHSFETAIWCLATQAPFEEAVLFAANLGDDADTTAAITGQLQGAYRGASTIPEPWLARLAWRKRIEATAAALFDASIA